MRLPVGCRKQIGSFRWVLQGDLRSRMLRVTHVAPRDHKFQPKKAQRCSIEQGLCSATLTIEPAPPTLVRTWEEARMSIYSNQYT